MTATSDQNQFRQPDTQLRQALACRFESGRFGRPVKPEIVNRTPISDLPPLTSDFGFAAVQKFIRVNPGKSGHRNYEPDP
ncbi:MAG: hypothetical protein ABSE16_15390 [Verrucomicrobiota bacterium]|jgi:hypothetical protein